jgi:hypothetical protein
VIFTVNKNTLTKLEKFPITILGPQVLEVNLVVASILQVVTTLTLKMPTPRNQIMAFEGIRMEPNLIKFVIWLKHNYGGGANKDGHKVTLYHKPINPHYYTQNH